MKLHKIKGHITVAFYYCDKSVAHLIVEIKKL